MGTIAEKYIDGGRGERHIQGRIQGISQGRIQEKQEMAINMMKQKLDFTFISSIAGLSIYQLRKIKSASKSKIRSRN